MSYTRELQVLDRELNMFRKQEGFEALIKNSLDQVYTVFECLIDKLEQLEESLQQIEDTLEGQKDRLDTLENNQ